MGITLADLARVVSGQIYIPIESSRAISDVWYNPLTETLRLSVRGQRFEFYNVPLTVVVGLANASSPGNYFNSYIRGAYR